MLAAKNLRKRKVAYVKGVDHLFIHCLAISRLWGEILSWFGLVWVMPDTVKEVIFTWNYGHYDKRRKISRT
uniref:ADP-ribosylation factor 3 n=1 Tax=Solanum tuberosum TaxID=4113 RepID=M1CMH1_SOLTU